MYCGLSSEDMDSIGDDMYRAFTARAAYHIHDEALSMEILGLEEQLIGREDAHSRILDVRHLTALAKDYEDKHPDYRANRAKRLADLRATDPVEE